MVFELMSKELFIEQMAKKSKEGFSFEQIRTQVFYYVLRECAGIMTLDAIVMRAMELYAEIVLKSKEP